MLDALRAGLVVPFDVVHEVVHTFEMPFTGRTTVCLLQSDLDQVAVPAPEISGTHRHTRRRRM